MPRNGQADMKVVESGLECSDNVRHRCSCAAVVTEAGFQLHRIVVLYAFGRNDNRFGNVD